MDIRQFMKRKHFW